MAEKLFSERSGIIPEKPLQIDNIDQDLRNRIWNIFFASYFERTTQNKSYASILNSIWKDFLKKPINDMPGTSNSGRYRGIFLELKWYRIYDLLEFIVKCENQINNPEDPENKTNVFIADFCSECNRAFEGEKSAFRFVDTQIVQIVDKTEISEVEESIEH